MTTNNIDDLPVEQLRTVAQTYGTPVYVLHTDRIRDNVRRVFAAFAEWKGPLRVHYSYKTNYLPHLCKTIHSLACGAEVTSEMELSLARRNGVLANDIIFSGLCKSEAAITDAFTNGVGAISVESLNELQFLGETSRRLNRSMKIFLRLCPVDWEEKRPDYRFGLTAAMIGPALAFLHNSPLLSAAGLHCHFGSQIETAEAYVRVWNDFVNAYPGLFEAQWLKVLDIGGGFPIQTIWEFGERGIFADGPASTIDPIETFGNQICDFLNRRVRNKTTLLLEPGRYLVGNAMTLVTRVLWTKEMGRQNWLICDGGMNLLPKIREEHHTIVALEPRPDAERIFYHVGGPLCSNFDIIGVNRRLPKAKRGDLLAVCDVGAYSHSRAITFQDPKPAVIALDGTVAEPVWRPETFADIAGFDVSHQKGGERNE